MKEQLYKKVYLNNDVNNLPQIEDEYYVMTKEDGMNIFNWYGANFSSNWLNEVKWYLQPIELPSEEEIKDAMNGDNNKIYGANWLLNKLK